jgi:hypothetical protein
MITNSDKSRTAWIFLLSVALILGMRGFTKIKPAVIKTVSIVVISLHPSGDREKQAMQIDRGPMYARYCVPIATDFHTAPMIGFHQAVIYPVTDGEQSSLQLNFGDAIYKCYSIHIPLIIKQGGQEV